MEVMFNSFEWTMKCTCFVTSKYSRISYTRKKIIFFKWEEDIVEGISCCVKF